MKDNQHEQLFTEQTAESEAPAFEELDNETAAAIGGGGAIDVYRDSGIRVLLAGYDTSTARVGPTINDRISSVKVNAGRWTLYENANFQGRSVTYGRGSYNVPSWFNDKASSLRRIAA